MVYLRIRTTLLVVLCAALGSAQEYDGPAPPKPDVPYLLHAENLIETEVTEAREEERNKEFANIVAGASSPALTPLAEPIFILLSENLEPNKLELYRLDVKQGQREVAFPKDLKKRMRGPRPIHLYMKQLRENLYWIEVNEGLENGEYCLSPQGSTEAFCFQVY
jgi:hypothetical protein